MVRCVKSPQEGDGCALCGHGTVFLRVYVAFLGGPVSLQHILGNAACRKCFSLALGSPGGKNAPPF